jgi:hypothetical protein
MMARHAAASETSWWRRQVTVGNMINLGAIGFACAGFYFSTGAALTDHAKVLDRHEKGIVELRQETQRIELDGRVERDKARIDVGTRAERTADGIAELNKRMAVAETKSDAIKEELVKIGRQLETVISKK